MEGSKLHALYVEEFANNGIVAVPYDELAPVIQHMWNKLAEKVEEKAHADDTARHG